MSSTSAGFSMWFMLMVAQVLLLWSDIASSEPNRDFYASKLCGRDRPHPLYKTIDGAVVISEMDADMNCVMTFQTESVLQRFMLRFEDLALDCGDHLFIYDGDLVTGKSKADLSCRNTRMEIGTIFTQSNFLTLKYVTDRYSKPGDGFRLVITAYKDAQMSSCNQLRCANTFCISRHLACDHVNHCGDNSDETEHAKCYTAATEVDSEMVFGIQFHTAVVAVLGIFVICLICVVHLILYYCRTSRQLQQAHRIALHGQSTVNLAQPAAYNETTGIMMSPAATRYATLPLDRMKDKPPPPYGVANGYQTTALMANGTHHQIQGHHVIVTDNGTNGVIPQVVYYK